METVVQKVLDVVEQYGLIAQNDALFVGLSGGADSVCLLRVLLLLKERLQYRSLTALHLHHGLRAETADRDADFAKQLCESLQVPLKIKRVDTAKAAADHHESVEEAGRRLRYAFFKEESDGVANAKIVTAHHADDDAETVLLNMFRGCGLRGIAGIPVQRGMIIRPMITCYADEIRQFCRDQLFDYIVDETNASDDFTRNRIRHTVMPAIAVVHPRAKENVLRLAEIAREEDAYLDSLALAVYERAKTVYDDVYDAPILRQESDVIAKRALRMAAQRCGISSLELKHGEELLDVLKSGGSCSLPGRVTAKCDGRRLCFSKQKEKYSDEISLSFGMPIVFGKYTYCANVLSREEYLKLQKVNKNLFNFCLAYDMIIEKLVVRFRRDGERFRPFPRRCTKSLKKWFVEQNIPAVARDLTPLICDRNGVLCIPGKAVDERCAVRDDTEKIVLIKIMTKKDCEYDVDA